MEDIIKDQYFSFNSSNLSVPLNVKCEIHQLHLWYFLKAKSSLPEKTQTQNSPTSRYRKPPDVTQIQLSYQGFTYEWLPAENIPEPQIL